MNRLPTIKNHVLAMTAILAMSNVVACAETAPSQAAETLTRKIDRPHDSVPGVTIEYGMLETKDGARLRTVLSRPENTPDDIPVIYFIQWLSCSTVELVDDDGWTQMLTTLIRDSGYTVMRTEKSGVGDSEGPACSELDYNTEVQHHAEALDAVIDIKGIDPDRVFLFGGSMGANPAPLIAVGRKFAGVIAWGGGAKTWYGRMLGFDRRSLEFTVSDPSKIADAMNRRALFHAEYLIKKKTPDVIAADNPDISYVWSGLIGTGDTDHYGRAYSFHHQAQNQNWAGAWVRVEAPVLVLYGEYDWVEDAEGHRLIADIVNVRKPGSAEFHILPKSDHHFSRYPSRKAAFDEAGGTKVGDEAAKIIMGWMSARLNQLSGAE